jgi:hypothetical protein
VHRPDTLSVRGVPRNGIIAERIYSDVLDMELISGEVTSRRGNFISEDGCFGSEVGGGPVRSDVDHKQGYALLPTLDVHCRINTVWDVCRD